MKLGHAIAGSIAAFALVACSAHGDPAVSESAGEAIVPSSCANPAPSSFGTLCDACGTAAGALYSCTQGDNNTIRGTCTLQQTCPYGCQNRPLQGLEWKDACLAQPGTLALSASSVAGGTTIQATVSLPTAHALGATVAFGSDNPALVPALSATIPMSATQTSVSFPVATHAVTSTTAVTVWGSVSWYVQQNGSFFGYANTEPLILTLTPGGGACTPTTCAAQGKNCGSIPDGCGGTLSCGSCTSPQTCGGGGVANVCGGSTSSGAQLTLTVSGRSGESVSSQPSGLAVPSGSSGTAPFPAGTSITLAASNGRDAIWSGACSSGGNKAKSCTFTITASASVAANIQ